MSADQLAGYRSAKEAQLQRFERATQGCDRSDSDKPEYREYFGLGEYAGGGVESPLTFKSYLLGSRQDRGNGDYPAAFSGPTVAKAEGSGVATESVAQAVVALVTVEGAFWLSGKDLAQLASAGCQVSRDEIARRATKRAQKRLRVLSGEAARWERAVSA